MFVRVYVLAVLPRLYQGWYSTAQQAGFWVLFEPYLSIYHISAGLQELQVLKALERFELKNTSLMV